MDDASYKIQPLRILDPITLQGKEPAPREWTVDQWIPHGEVTTLNGPGSAGKTLAAMQLATCAAIGRPWFGFETRACRVLMVPCEDSDEELHRRQADINRHYQCDMADLERLRWLPRRDHDNVLATFDSTGRMQTTTFLHQLQHTVEDFGAELVILDSRADFFVGNENDRSQVNRFVKMAIGSLIRPTGASIILLGHPSQAGMNSGDGESGSTHWTNAVRSRLHLFRPKDEETGRPDRGNDRLLERPKANYAALGEALKLTWEDGVFIADSSSGGIVASIERGVKDRALEEAFIGELHALKAEGRAVSHSPGSNYAPAVLAKRPAFKGRPKRDITDTMERLIQSSRIRCNEVVGKDKWRRPIIGLFPPDGAAGH